MADTIVTFTAKTIDEILKAGGSYAWKLRWRKAKEAKYLVCARNNKTRDSNGTEDHGTGFMIGRVSEIIPAPNKPERFSIQISDWARIDKPKLWQNWRNPVRYTNLSDLGIDPARLKFEKVPKSSHPVPKANNSSLLTFEAAKKGLAAAFGVKPDAIEIVIRG